MLLAQCEIDRVTPDRVVHGSLLSRRTLQYRPWDILVSPNWPRPLRPHWLPTRRLFYRPPVAYRHLQTSSAVFKTASPNAIASAPEDPSSRQSRYTLSHLDPSVSSIMLHFLIPKRSPDIDRPSHAQGLVRDAYKFVGSGFVESECKGLGRSPVHAHV